MMYIHESEYHKYIGAGRLIKGAQIIELKVVLLDTEPEVWRKIAVPSNYTLEQLGRVAACAIGWIPRYFNFFGQNDEFIGGYDPYMKPEEKKLKTIVARDIIISSLFVDEKTRDKSVTMDYGSDGWLHEITFEKLRDADKKHYPKCVDGKNACPPEDCCGPDGYKSMMASLKDPKHEDHEETKEWLNEAGYKRFNPKKFSVSSVIIGD